MSDIQSGSWLRVDKPRKIRRILINTAGVLLVLNGAWLYTKQQRGAIFFICWGVLLILWDLMLFRLFNHLRVAILVRRNINLYDKEVLIDMDDTRWTVSSLGQRSEMTWDKFIGYRFGKRNLLLYLSKDFTVNIPRRVFGDNCPEKQLLKILKENNVPEL